MISFKGAHLPQDIMRMGVRWYVVGLELMPRLTRNGSA
jgi:hypothetical protein